MVGSGGASNTVGLISNRHSTQYFVLDAMVRQSILSLQLSEEVQSQSRHEYIETIPSDERVKVRNTLVDPWNCRLSFSLRRVEAKSHELQATSSDSYKFVALLNKNVKIKKTHLDDWTFSYR
jgi:hypothetical protein